MLTVRIFVFQRTILGEKSLLGLLEATASSVAVSQPLAETLFSLRLLNISFVLLTNDYWGVG